MNITLSAAGARKFGRVLLIAGNLFAIGAAVHYVNWTYKSRMFFEVLTFDLNYRLPEIKQNYLAVQKAQTPTTTSTTLPGPMSLK